MTSMTNFNPNLDSSEPSATSGGADSLVHSFDKLSIQVPGTTHDDVEEEILWPRSARTDTPPSAVSPSVSFDMLEDLSDSAAGFELVRGDYGTKTYTPRPRGAFGHRSTKSESAVAYMSSPAPSGLEQTTATPAAITRGSMAERWDYAFAHGPGKGAARTPVGGDRDAVDLTVRESKKDWSEQMEGVDVNTEVQRPVLTSSVHAQEQKTPTRPHSTGEITSASRPVSRPLDADKTSTKRGRSKKSKGKAVKPGQGPGSGSGTEAAGATSEPQVQAPSQKSKAKAAVRSNTARTPSPAARALHWSEIASGKRKPRARSAKQSGSTDVNENEKDSEPKADAVIQSDSPAAPNAEPGAARVPLHWSEIASGKRKARARSAKQSDSTDVNEIEKDSEPKADAVMQSNTARAPLHWSEIASGKRKPRASSAKQSGSTDVNEKEVQQQGKLKVKAKPKRLGRKKEVQQDEKEVIAPSPAPSTPRGLGQRSVVDDVSENGDLPSLEVLRFEKDRLLTTAYDEAVKFMNSFIQHPYYYTSKASRLTFLQALIVELGLVSVHDPKLALPSTLTSARAMIKSHAFLNVRDYLAVRAEGIEALRHAMHPNRKALVQDLRRGRKKSRRAPIQWVKETGLTVLLVSCRS